MEPEPKRTKEDAAGEGITMGEFIEHDERQRQIERAVYGSFSDDKCTYNQGYLARQPLHTCLTCIANGAPGGYMCSACATACHEGHNIVELWTKRNIRCDCGTSRLPSGCKLVPAKQDNVQNQYSQNLHGLFCVCHKPYPDETIPEDVDMAQCIVCEDWHHLDFSDAVHIMIESSTNTDDNTEFVCTACSYYTWPVLGCYQQYLGNAPPAMPIKPAPDMCTRPALSTAPPAAGFYKEELRSRLCRCPTCSRIYSEMKIEFLLDTKDAVSAYEEQHDALREQQDTQIAASAMNTMAQLNPSQQYMLAQGLQQLREATRRMAENSQNGVVTVADVQREMSHLQNATNPPPPST